MAQTTYWLGTLEGDQIRFSAQVPADAVSVITHKTKAPGEGDNTTPHFREFTHSVGGQPMRFYANELAWETPNLSSGSLTWRVDAGDGYEWKTCNTQDPLWNSFAQGLQSLSTAVDGWSSSRVVIAETPGSQPPQVKLNRDGSLGKPSADKTARWRLAEMSSKASLSPAELDEARGHFLAIANAGRANANYRREAGAKAALDLPTGLSPLTLNAAYNQAAQIQADYCARVQQAIHENGDPGHGTVEARLKSVGHNKGAYEAAGQGSLDQCPETWMRSETHYRPWWNLDGEVVTQVGFGAAKASSGKWYLVAVIG